MSVAADGSRGKTTPLQSGQCSPQPAPDPVARTYAPQRITPMLYASTAQANLARPLNRAITILSVYRSAGPHSAFRIDIVSGVTVAPHRHLLPAQRCPLHRCDDLIDLRLRDFDQRKPIRDLNGSQFT